MRAWNNDTKCSEAPNNINDGLQICYAIGANRCSVSFMWNNTQLFANAEIGKDMI